MTDKLDEIRKRLEAATPGPWEIRRSKSGYPYQISAPNGSDRPGGIKDVTRWASIGLPSSEEGEGNAQFIAHAPEDIAYLLAEVDRLQGLLAEKQTDIVERLESRLEAELEKAGTAPAP